jgi:hypothetical protein
MKMVDLAGPDETQTLPATAPYRPQKPPPPAFAEVFIRTGWRGIEEAYGSRTGCNRRWIAQLGDHDLLRARRDYRVRLRDIKRARAA